MAANNRMMIANQPLGITSSEAEFLYDIFLNSKEGLCTRDLKKSFTWTNKTFLNLLGLNINVNIIGLELEGINTSLEQYKSKILNAEKSALEMQDLRHVFFSAISPVSFKRCLFTLCIQPIYNAKGESTGTHWRISRAPVNSFIFNHSSAPKINPTFVKMKSPFNLFTVSEWNVAWPVFVGWRENDIAQHLKISQRHFKRVLRTCYQKLCVDNFDEFHTTISILGWATEVPHCITYITNHC